MNPNYETIIIEKNNAVATVWLNRPEVRNAMNNKMINELLQAFFYLSKDDTVRVIVLRGKGKAFCTGADLNWMRDAINNTNEENMKESKMLAMCFHSIYNCPKPTIAAVHGAAMGGANGLLAACDFAYAAHNTKFGLSEVKLGLNPSTISPYIIKRVGEFNARDLMLTGRIFDGITAQQLQLINQSVAEDELDNTVQNTIDHLLSSAPNAVTACKKLIYEVVNDLKHAELVDYTAVAIASIRKTEEAQEGMTAFLEKRKPNWNL